MSEMTPPPPPPPPPPAVPPPPPIPPPTPGYYGPAGNTSKNSLGIWALVLGIVSFVCCLGLLTGVPAIILGTFSRKAADQGLATNRSLGTAGMVLGIVAVVLVTLVWIANAGSFIEGFSDGFNSTRNG